MREIIERRKDLFRLTISEGSDLGPLPQELGQRSFPHFVSQKATSEEGALNQV